VVPGEDNTPALNPVPAHATVGGDDVKVLRCFVAVAEELSFTRAARRLGLSQPQLSRAVAKLEAQLGVELLRRTTREVVLTEAGALLLNEGAAALAALERAYRRAQHRAGTPGGHVRVGWSSGAAGMRTSELLRAFSSRHPEITLELCHIQWADQVSAITDGRVDVQFLRFLSIPPLVGVEPLFYEQRVAAMASDHPLAGRESLMLADIRLEPLITAVAPRSWIDRWYGSPRPDGGALRYETAADTAEEMFELIAAGRGIAIVGASAAFSFARTDIVFVPIADIEPILVSVAWRPDLETTESRKFIAVARSVLLDRTLDQVPSRSRSPV